MEKWLLIILILAACSTMPSREQIDRAPASYLVTNCQEVFQPFLHSTPQYVLSLDDFYMHMYNHASNVRRISLAIFREIKTNPQKWKEVFEIPEDIAINNELAYHLMRFISLHDASKINTRLVFQNRFNRKNLIIEDLYKLYGKNLQKMSPEEKSVINELNAIDDVVRKEFQEEFNLPDWEIKFLHQIEKLADGIERGTNPVTAEEMAKRPWKESLVLTKEIMEKKEADGTFDEEVVHMILKRNEALHVEADYDLITVSFVDYKKKTKKLRMKLLESGLNLNTLSPFSENQLIYAFERYSGRFADPDDPMIVKKLSHYFFETEEGAKTLQEFSE